MGDSIVSDVLLKELSAAAHRVRDRSEQPPWSEHPTMFDLALLATNDLSQEETRHVCAHVRDCVACQERKEKILERLSNVNTQAGAAEIVLRLMAEDIRL